MIVLGIPFVMLSNPLGDSGFIEIKNTLEYLGNKYGVKSVVYMDKSYEKTVFDSDNVKMIFSNRSKRPRADTFKWALGEDQVFDMFPGKSLFPVDAVLTNKKIICQTLAMFGLDRKVGAKGATSVPIILDVLKVGAKTHDKMFPLLEKYEAFSYAAADRIIFSTSLEKKLGLSLASKYISMSEVKSLDKRSVVVGDGVSDKLKNLTLPDDEVRRRILSPRKELSIAFVGRTNYNKGIDDIVATVRPLFALHGLKLTLVTPSKAIPTHPRFGDVNNLFKSAVTGVGKEAFVSKILPSFDVILNASRFEGYTVSVAEAVYTGIPVLLPNKKWAVALVGEDYPFLYNGVAEMYSLVNRFQKGKIKEEECERFLRGRRKFQNEMESNLSEMVYSLLSEEVEKSDRAFMSEAHSRIEERFLETFGVGEEFTVKQLVKMYPGMGERIMLGPIQKYDGFSIYKFVKQYCEPVDPREGRLRRVV